MRRAASVVGGLIVVALVWGTLVEPRVIDRQELDIGLPQLPTAWDGAEVAFLSDFQVGLWLDNAGTVQRMVAQVIERDPDLVLLGGDFVYSASPEIAVQVAEVVDLFRPLTEAGLTTYAVLGNHDVEQDAGDLLQRELAAVAIAVLSNEAMPLPSPGDVEGPPLHLVGIAPHLPGRDRPAQAVAAVPPDAARLVFMHNPDSFPALPAGTAPIALAGHTHGGQVRVPFLPEWSYLALLQGGEITADGWIDGYGEPGNQLYVSRGVGMSVAPIRLFCLPELTILVLHAT